MLLLELLLELKVLLDVFDGSTFGLVPYYTLAVIVIFVIVVQVVFALRS
jgi:hypothetical protein